MMAVSLKGGTTMISANIDKATRRAVYRRDGYQCALCSGIEGLQIHHAIPRSQGGTDYIENLVTLCWRCHAAVHGTKLADRPVDLEAADYAQAIVEYLADYYALRGIVWYPWE